MTRPDGAQDGAETERLLLPWAEEYSGDFARVCTDPEAMRFISGGRPLTDDDIRSIIQRTLAMWDEDGYGPWAAVEKQTGLTRNLTWQVGPVQARSAKRTKTS